MECIQCDRCGAIFDSELDTSKIKIKRWDNFLYGRLCTRKLDICEKCTKELIKWLRKDANDEQCS